LAKDDRQGIKPFIWSTDAQKRLQKIEVTQAIIALVEERRKYWHLLQFLDGQHVAQIEESRRADIESLQAQYQESVTLRDSSLDTFARAMSELAASSKAPVAAARTITITPVAGAVPAAAGAATAVADALVTYDVADQVKCTDCKTCYQDLPELFEKTRIVVDGESKEVAQLIPGAMAKVKVTAELKSRIARVVANCDSEIIR
jgi:pyruvate-ferredoxin/flavodoxin oxidoreductase